MLTAIQKRFEAEGASGTARVRSGAGKRAVIGFRWSSPTSVKERGANLVVTMEAGRVVTMKDYRRSRAAWRAAGLDPKRT